MRSATHGKYPRFIVWENVPGAFSSNKGEDFRAVLTAIIQTVESEAEVPAPDKKGWPNADVLLGNGWSVAYRTVDAQYFGVAQRRRRIYLVADFGRRTAPARFCLSAKACQGILRRASLRGKRLPDILRIALEQQLLSNPEQPPA